jgi:predicted transcriptional regulator
MPKSNLLKGRNSFDANISGEVVAFINHNISEYPTSVGGPNFTPVLVEKEKDISLNIAKQHAKEEYERIMEMVRILEEQAKQLVSRLDATDLVHKTKCTFVPIHGKEYHIYFNEFINGNQMSMIGPKEWCAGPGEHIKFVASVRKKGDSTWEYIDEDSINN